MKRVTIIGAGIAGLTTSIALKQRGFEVEIFEAAPQFKKAGSGINLAMNAMQVYKKLGVYDDILKQANYTSSMESTNKKLKVLAGVDFTELESKFGVKNVAIHRAELHEILVNHLGNTPIYLNKRLKSITQENNKVLLNFDNRTQHYAHIVIGADGIHSEVRESIFKDSMLRDANQLCWRGITNIDLDSEYKNKLKEAWGKGNRFGFVHISKKEVYWYALINKNLASQSPNLKEIFADYHPVISKIIDQTLEENILLNEIWDLKPMKKWYDKNVCLIGDAAHATTPNMGQGACQAIESALVLSNCLAEEQTTEQAFEKYQTMRMEKAHNVTNTSWKLGKLAQTNNLLIVLLRNMIVPLIPKSATKKQNIKLFTITPNPPL
ncbi:FAD-dependent monooxygenase [Yeosuana marina]|uniref:FAD-dependent monooxygenase n=1 Tax=Yeosuana marina TaxID=1565536 RepID=UPI00142007F7|nr:FAD-dependent monooxygenase [Yeosuana marina]